MPENSLPTKTKIAAWWLIIFSILLSIFIAGYCILEFFSADRWRLENCMVILLFTLIFSIIISLSAFFVLKNKKRSWFFLVIILAMILFFELPLLKQGISLWQKTPSGYFNIPGRFFINVFMPLFLVLSSGGPLILLFIDSKNFFKIKKTKDIEEKKGQNIFIRELSKTEVAAFFTIFSSILMIFVVYFLRKLFSLVFIFLYLIFCFFSLLFSIFILQKKRWAWYLEIFFLLGLIMVGLYPILFCFGNGADPDLGISGCILVYLFNASFVTLLPFLISFLLYYFDRKNFFKIAK